MVENKFRDNDRAKGNKDSLSQAHFLNLLRQHIRLSLFLMLGVGLLFISFAFYLPGLKDNTYLSYIIREIGKGFLVASIITFFVRVLIEQHYDKYKDKYVEIMTNDVSESLLDIKKSISEQLEKLYHASASLEAMLQSGILRIYSSRRNASKDIALDLTNPFVSEIKIMAISLNDFVRSDQYELGEAWDKIVSIVRSMGQALPHSMDIKILIIDPECIGGRLRSKGEAREKDSKAGGLLTDVAETAKFLISLKEELKSSIEKTINDNNEKSENVPNINFDFRLYRLPPILFLCQTDTISYVQQYHFWSLRNNDVPIPVIRYLKVSGTPSTQGVHEEMKAHFEWIWENASISATDYLKGKSIGIDKALYQHGAVNVFNDSKEARDRIIYSLGNAKKRIYIQGISLHSYFAGRDSALFIQLQQLASNPSLDIKILILDPDSEQALYRSYREHLFDDQNITFEKYCSDKSLHKRSRLYVNTKETIANIKQSISPHINKTDSIRLYDSTPSCFLLIIDDAFFVEQYHYGKILPAEAKTDKKSIILGKDMPLFEYSVPSNLYDESKSDDESKRPSTLELLDNHFQFVFDKCSRPLPTNTK